MSSFYAFLSRMKYINRWSLMRNSERENVSEHSHMVAMIAHALAVIRNKVFSGSVNADSIAVKALFHESSEVITGDLPTPIKYYNAEIMSAYKDIEEKACDKIIAKLPLILQEEYTSLLKVGDKLEREIIKSADKLCAYIKCIEELKCGNMEFKQAGDVIKSDLDKNNLEEVKYFMTEFLGAFSLSLDQL